MIVVFEYLFIAGYWVTTVLVLHSVIMGSEPGFLSDTRGRKFKK